MSTVLGAAVIVVVAVLVVRYFRGLETGKLPVDNGGATENQEATVGQTYTVKAGDTLWSIAEAAYASGYNWTDIAQANNLANANQIEVGQKLTIPNVESQVKTVAEREIAEQKTNSIAGATYTVVQSDSLWKIAVRAYGDGYQWVNIARENNLANPNFIHAGNVLTLPR